MSKKNWGRQDFIQSLHQQTSLPLPDCAHILEDVISLIKEGIEESREIKIQKFGNFYVYKSKVRIGRNPRTGEEKIISARKKIRFKPSSFFGKKLNEDKASPLINETILPSK